MSDYINKRRALDAVCATCPFDCTNEERAESPCVNVAELMSIRPEDVVPVRRGRLVDAGVSASGHRLAMCTICKRKMREGVEIGIVSRYCPNCGVRLDEEELNEI